jgi:hypothetical protein
MTTRSRREHTTITTDSKREAQLLEVDIGAMRARFSPVQAHDIAQGLRRDHDEIRVKLARAIRKEGTIARVAKRLAELCFAHFESEELIVFPMLAQVHSVFSSEAMGSKQGRLQEQMGELGREGQRFARDHQAILSASEVLLEVANRESTSEVAELAHILAIHERLEEDLVLSAYELNLTMVGKSGLWRRPAATSSSRSKLPARSTPRTGAKISSRAGR